jgi:hypothetical protein
MHYVWFALLLVLFGVSVFATLSMSRSRQVKACPVCRQPLRATAKTCQGCDTDVSGIVPDAEEGRGSRITASWGLFGAGLFVLAVMAVFVL